jgi:putative endonuclease
MGWFVYLVRCRDGSLYTGISTDVQARVAVHNDGRGARYTRSRRPVTLVYVEPRRFRSTALRREAAIKALPRAAKWSLITTKPRPARTIPAGRGRPR